MNYLEDMSILDATRLGMIESTIQGQSSIPVDGQRERLQSDVAKDVAAALVGEPPSNGTDPAKVAEYVKHIRST